MSKWGLQYAHKTDAFSATPVWANDAREALLRVPPLTLNVIDLGCGSGRLLPKLRRQVLGRVVGVDPNREGFALCRGYCQAAELHTSLESLTDETFEVAVSLHSLPQMDDPAAVLTLLWERLVRGGSLIVVTHNRNFSRVRWLKDVFTGYRSDPTITTNFTLGSLVQLMRDTGFQVVEAKRYGLGWWRLIPFCAPRLLVHARKPE